MSERKTSGVLLAVMTAGIFASASAAIAGESSAGFCASIDAGQRATQRAQGLESPQGGNTRLGVILWDEYRRLRQPGDNGDTPLPS